MLIETLHGCVGGTIEGVYHLSDIQMRVDRFERPYGYALLEDRSGALPLYIWRGEMPHTPALTSGGAVRATLTPRYFRGRLIGDALLLTQEGLSMPNPIQLIPRRELANPTAAARLQDVIDGLELPALRHFLMRVFEDAALARTYLAAPASQAHHHAYPGGLVDHSLQVAEIAGRALVVEEPAIVALTKVAGLLHDLGKVRALKPHGVRTRMGYVLNHEALTLELLAPGLAYLDRAWPDGGVALRYLLTWHTGARETRPLMPAALALQFADRYSSATDTRAQAFIGAPEWQRFARHGANGPVSRFWRPIAAAPVLTGPGE